MTSVPVSLPLTNGPPTVNSVLPPSLPMSLLTNPTLPNPTGVASNVSTTRILKLSGFNPDLKTRDIQVIFQEWEEDRGGFKLKWVDDVTCLIVFNDPTVGKTVTCFTFLLEEGLMHWNCTAKRAFLTLLASPPPILSVDQGAKIQAYNGPDVTHILTSVQNRPRSRSNASSHSRKGSMNVSSPTSTGRRGSMNQGDGGNTVGHRTSFRNLAGAATNGNGNGGGNRNLPSSAQIQAAIDSATAGAGGGSALSSSPTSTQPPVGERIQMPPIDPRQNP
ncbi:hypothetical protein BT69DRAFT_1292008 [Atractiella rhizophila]|nr:hypothetical protein BT69DRAFT_1292008 [Atractiella rhizophila]